MYAYRNRTLWAPEITLNSDRAWRHKIDLMMMMMMMMIVMVCGTYVFHNSYNQFLLPPPVSPKNCTSLWLLSWMVPLTVNSIATTESSSCIHEPRAACVYRQHVDPGSRSGIFVFGLYFQPLSWVLDDSCIMYCNATHCVRSWSFKKKKIQLLLDTLMAC